MCKRIYLIHHNHNETRFLDTLCNIHGFFEVYWTNDILKFIINWKRIEEKYNGSPTINVCKIDFKMEKIY